MGLREKRAYARKLTNPKWQKVRLLIFQRDQWACCNCGNTEEQLEVAHLKYTRWNPWEEDLENLLTLCHSCHMSMDGAREDANLRADIEENGDADESIYSIEEEEELSPLVKMFNKECRRIGIRYGEMDGLAAIQSVHQIMKGQKFLPHWGDRFKGLL